MLVVVALAAGAVFVFASAGASAPSAKTPPTWYMWAVGGKRFAGIYTNNTGKPVIAIAIGTSAKANDPITFFRFGKTKTAAPASCSKYKPYGSVLCSNLNVAPHKSVLFVGTTAKTVKAGGQARASGRAAGGTLFQDCDSIDNLTFDCKDQPTKADGPAGRYLTGAINKEREALADIHGDHLADAERELKQSREILGSIGSWMLTGVSGAQGDLDAAKGADNRAIDKLPDNPERAAGWVRTGIADKKRMRHRLKSVVVGEF